MGILLNNVEAAKGNTAMEPIAPGKYDAVLSAIISLEKQTKEYKGEKSVQNQLKLLFEIPSIIRETKDGQLPALIGKDVNVVPSIKGNFGKVLAALNHKTMTDEELFDIINTDGAIESLLGKSCVLVLNTYKTKYGTERNDIKDIQELDARLPQPKASREPFIFSVKSPDLTIFKDKLSKWTRDQIMKAVNADEFPKELHSAYRDLKEQEQDKSASVLA